MFSILILTKNEEANLPSCLASVKWCDDVVVLDSFSTDRTVEVAREAGVRVFQRAFDDFAGQRNHALDRIEFKNPWLFHLDADELTFPAWLERADDAEIRIDHQRDQPRHELQQGVPGAAEFARKGHRGLQNPKSEALISKQIQSTKHSGTPRISVIRALNFVLVSDLVLRVWCLVSLQAAARLSSRRRESHVALRSCR